MLTYDDEAHRIQRSSNYMGDKKNEQTYLSMVMSLLYCAKICVFFIDDHQGVKKEEIGLSSSIVDAAENYSERLNSETEQFENRLLAYRDRLRAKKDKIADLTQKRDSIPTEKYLSQYERLNKSINKLQDYMVPSCYIHRQEMLFNENGKINRKALTAEYIN